MSSKTRGWRASAVEKSVPPRTSPTTSFKQARKPWLSVCSQRISRHSRSGIPAEIMVASCRVKSRMSFRLTRALLAETLPKPAKRPAPAAAWASMFMTERPFFLISATASSWDLASIVASIFLPEPSRALYLNAGMSLPLPQSWSRGRRVVCQPVVRGPPAICAPPPAAFGWSCMRWNVRLKSSGSLVRSSASS